MDRKLTDQVWPMGSRMLEEGSMEADTAPPNFEALLLALINRLTTMRSFLDPEAATAAKDLARVEMDWKAKIADDMAFALIEVSILLYPFKCGRGYWGCKMGGLRWRVYAGGRIMIYDLSWVMKP